MTQKYVIEYTGSFKKDYKRCVKRNLDISLLKRAISLLAETGTLPQEYKVHRLSGKYSGFWECHIQPDWLLVWQQDDKVLRLLFSRTGTHADLF